MYSASPWFLLAFEAVGGWWLTPCLQITFHTLTGNGWSNRQWGYTSMLFIQEFPIGMNKVPSYLTLPPQTRYMMTCYSPAPCNIYENNNLWCCAALQIDTHVTAFLHQVFLGSFMNFLLQPSCQLSYLICPVHVKPQLTCAPDTSIL